ncbi:hypothetical protein ANN_21184 [Periplaneta americana]|uniref:Uncharacterized protein n=1 Tax=Periplaneta americana TaxID=6978 RepID=A0ABQ8SFT9_PERAM|nr:hypothetical protein ANN_21184 [Periplaneta americana]
MADLCEGDNEPPGSLNVITFLMVKKRSSDDINSTIVTRRIPKPISADCTKVCCDSWLEQVTPLIPRPAGVRENPEDHRNCDLFATSARHDGDLEPGAPAYQEATSSGGAGSPKKSTDEALSGRPVTAATPSNVRGIIKAAIIHLTVQASHRLTFTSSDQ